MASTVLPQALYMFPRNPTQIQLKTLGFSSSFSCYPTAFNSTRVSISRISPNTPIVQKLSNKSFIVRAESNSEAEAENVEENEAVVDSEAPEAVPELESEVAKPPRKPRVKLGDIMGILNKRAVEESEKERPIPAIRTGDVVEIKLEVPENRRRLSVYKGIVISKQNAGIHTTIRIRRIIAGIGVEIVFPVYSPNIKELRVLSHRKVRRARLYYLRDKLPRLSTFK